MLIQNDFNTKVVLDPIEWFDVEWDERVGEYRRVRVTEVRRTVYPAQGGGHGCVVFGVGLPYLKTGELGKRPENVHRLSELVGQIPPRLHAALSAAGIFDEIDEDA